MPTGIYQLHWYPTGSRDGFGYELDLVWFGFWGVKTANSRRVWSVLPTAMCAYACGFLSAAVAQRCSALLTSLCKPFICPIIQPEAILFDTHIPQAPALLGHCVLCALSLCPVGCHTNSNTFMTHANFQLLRIPTGSNTPPPTTPTHTSHLTMLVLPPCHLEKVVSPSALCVCYVKRIAAMRHLIHLMP